MFMEVLVYIAVNNPDQMCRYPFSHHGIQNNPLWQTFESILYIQMDCQEDLTYQYRAGVDQSNCL